MDRDFHDEYPFKFIEGPLTLATLSSTEVSLNLWRHKISIRGETTRDSVLETNFSCAEFYTLPSSIKGVIDEKIISVREDLQKWVKFVDKSHFEWQSVLRQNLDDVVFGPNGRISYSKTAARVITRDDIENETKFKIACVFCLEDEIKQLWPLITKNANFARMCLADKSMSLYYWYCLMASKKNTSSVRLRIWKEFRRQNWASMGFFWRLWNDKFKATTALKILKFNDIDAMMCILPKLNELEAQEVFEAKASEILSILLSNPEYVDHVFVLWTHMENVISEEVFLQLIRGLWKLAWNILKSDHMRRYKADGILLEIWTRASDHFKSHVLNHSEDFFRMPAQPPAFIFHYGHNMEFLLDLLRNNSAEFRNKVWLENWKQIVLRSKPMYVKQFVELCLPDEETIDVFKYGNLLDFKYFQMLLIRHGFYSDLGEYLTYCTKDAESMNHTSQQVLQSNMSTVISTLLDGNNFENFNRFVDVLFPNPDSATEFKQKLFWSTKSLKCLFVTFNNGRLTECQKIISRWATSEKNLQKMKIKFLYSLRKYLTSVQTCEFDVAQWKELMKWCTKNENEIAAFKKSLDIDEIFEFCMATYAIKSWSFGYYEPCSGGLFFYDNFASWYFDDEQAKRNFKEEKMYNYDKGKAIRQHLQDTPPFNYKRMLHWAFDKDEKKTGEFEQRLLRDKVITSILDIKDSYF